MKTALCLSGHPRFLEEGYLYWKRNLLDCNDVDVFCHIWHDPAKVGCACPSAPWHWNGKTDYIQKDSVERVMKLYQPKGMWVAPDRHMDYQLHQRLGVALSGKLRLDDAYDWVVRGRYDFALMQQIQLTDYSAGGIYFSDECQMPDSINDMFAFGSADVMGTYEELYCNMRRLEAQGVRWFSETLLYHWLKEKSVPLRPMPLRFAIIRGNGAVGNEINAADCQTA